MQKFTDSPSRLPSEFVQDWEGSVAGSSLVSWSILGRRVMAPRSQRFQQWELGGVGGWMQVAAQTQSGNTRILRHLTGQRSQSSFLSRPLFSMHTGIPRKFRDIVFAQPMREYESSSHLSCCFSGSMKKSADKKSCCMLAWERQK